MTEPETELEKINFWFSNENVWSSLGFEFRGFETKILKILSQQINYHQFESQDDNNDLESKVRSEIQCFENEMRKKLSKILFNTSVNESQAFQRSNKIQEFENKISLQKQNYEAKVKDLNQKIKLHQKLTKIYEKALSQNKKTQILSQKRTNSKDISESLLYVDQSANQSFKTHKSLRFERIYSIRIESQEKHSSISESNLSYSRLTSSRMSSSRMDSCALRELQSNWNKSVNLSSKSLKSANKEHQKSMKKEDKSFVKSHINEKNLNQSSIKKSQNSTKMNSTEIQRSKLDKRKQAMRSDLISFHGKSK